MSKKFLLISPKNRTVYNFRGDLISDIQKKGYNVIVTGPNTDGKDEIDKLGVEFFLIPLKKNGLSIWADLNYFYKLFKLIKREKPNVTLGYTIKPVIFGSIAAKLAGVGNVNALITGTGYAFLAKGFKASIIRFLVSILYSVSFTATNTVIFQNPDDRDLFIKRRMLKKNKTRLVNGSGVNMRHFRPTDFPDQITFFMLSRMLLIKGVQEYIQAAALVKAKYPQIRFILLGAFEDMPSAIKYEELKPYIEQGIIDYFGETDDVRKYYSQCSVYVLPSWAEGTPRTVLEAMAMGRPIITTNSRGCRETVVEGKNGFMVPINDPRTLALKMESIVNDQSLIEKMGIESLNICREKFEIQLVNKNMIKYLQIS
jgi:glycosyltransferase involved in cell wall biosynthesis